MSQRTIKFRLSLKGKIVGYESFSPDEDGYIKQSWNVDNYGGWIFGIPPKHDKKDSFTGLNDCNGREIYEGDIVFNNDIIWEIYYTEGAWRMSEEEKTDNDHLLLLEENHSQIIGNIYEDEHLLSK